jgi:hypothetical protein
MVSNTQIISDLRVIHEANHTLELLTNYKGVPFICKAIIKVVDNNTVQVIAKDPCLVCLLKDKKLRVLGSDYFEPSVATVVSMDIISGEITLSNFTYFGTKLGERMIVRVEPKGTIPVKLQIEDDNITGDMADISMNGMGVRIASSLYDSYPKPGTTLNIGFQLPNGEISMSGTVVSVIKLPDTFRLAIRYTQNGGQKIVIFRYLVDRRAEIEQELVSSYQATLNKAQR